MINDSKWAYAGAAILVLGFLLLTFSRQH